MPKTWKKIGQPPQCFKNNYKHPQNSEGQNPVGHFFQSTKTKMFPSIPSSDSSTCMSLKEHRKTDRICFKRPFGANQRSKHFLRTARKPRKSTDPQRFPPGLVMKVDEHVTAGLASLEANGLVRKVAAPLRASICLAKAKVATKTITLQAAKACEKPLATWDEGLSS